MKSYVTPTLTVIYYSKEDIYTTSFEIAFPDDWWHE